MTRQPKDPFPKQGRIRGQFDTLIEHDPLEQYLAHLEAKQAEAREQIANGKTLDADPADLRGIPCIARGVGGTSPGTNPLTEAIARIMRTVR